VLMKPLLLPLLGLVAYDDDDDSRVLEVCG